MGSALVALAAAFAAYIAAVMEHRIATVAEADTYRKALRYELVLCGALLLFALDVRFDLVGRLPGPGARMLGWAARIAVAAATAALLAIAVSIAAGGLARDAGGADTAIVLGMALENGRPTRDLRFRIEAAERFAREHPGAKLILTGGNPVGGVASEAEVMRDLLVEKGVPEARILLEQEAVDTRQNFANAARMIDPRQPVAIVTSSWHMSRAVRLAREAGFADTVRVPARSDPLQYGANLMWEVVMKLDLWTQGWRARPKQRGGA
ncbi:MAG: YdcF family protein [Clostridia bacterium]|nr:YdcF family protein [Clostridia bacterium]